MSRWSLALVAGLTCALSLPPWGWWPLAWVGVGAFHVLAERAERRRSRSALAFWMAVGWFGLGVVWMWFFSAPGYVASVMVFAAMHALAEGLVGGPTLITRPALHTLAEGLRAVWPFGGVPVASLAVGQAGGPLLELVRIGGPLLLTWFTWQLATLLGEAARVAARRTAGTGHQTAVARYRLSAAAGLAALLCLAVVAPDGASAPAGTLRLAVVQGGGPQGTRAVRSDPAVVFARHLAATATIAPGSVDAVLWPENIIDVERLAGSPELEKVVAEARRLAVPMIVSVTEDSADDRFVNAQVVVLPSGTVSSRYEKVRRVPFGEYMPMRSLLHALGAPTDLVPRDARGGVGPTRLDLPDGTVLAPAISWETFFTERVAAGIDQGGEVVINPTNGSSYTWTVVQSQQIASSRLRAVEQGRWVVQAAPTGFSALIDPSGAVVQRSSVSEQRVLVGTVTRLRGHTWYHHLGQWPWALGLGAVAALGWVAALRRALTRRGAPARRG